MHSMRSSLSSAILFIVVGATYTSYVFGASGDVTSPPKKVLPTPRAEKIAEISMQEAIDRLISYGLINEKNNDERDDSIEVLHHFAKLKNGDEEINEFPYSVRLIQLGTPGNKVPISCVHPFVMAGATVQGEGGDTSPLQAAAELGDNKMIAYLLQAGADLHYRDADRMMALDYAVGSQEKGTVGYLLERGAVATPNAMVRAASGDREILQKMLEYGGVISAETLVAALFEPDNLELLLDSGGDIYSRCRNGKTLFQSFIDVLPLSHPSDEILAHLLDLLEQYDADFYLLPSQKPHLPGYLSPELRQRIEALYHDARPRPASPADDDYAEEV